jgi:predicted N-acetyltransferase YhbS
MKPPAVTIRSAQPSDAAAIAALTTQLGYHVEASAVADRLSRILARSDQQFLVADDHGETVGWIHILLSEYVEADAFVLIGGLVVDRHYRNQGIGRRLLAHAEEWARQHGCAIVRLSSSSVRTEAHAFYQRVGFAIIKTQYSFVKLLDGASPETLHGLVPKVDAP